MGLLEDESQTVKTRHSFCLTLWLIFMNRLPIPKKCRSTSLVFTLTLCLCSWPPFGTYKVQTYPAGITQSFVEERKVEMRRAKERNPRVLTERSQAERGEIRERERSERSDRGGGGGGGRRRNWKPWSIERLARAAVEA